MTSPAEIAYLRLRGIALIAISLVAGCASEPERAPGSVALESDTVVTTSALSTRSTTLGWAAIRAMDWPSPQTKYQNYNDATKRAFWSIYPNGGRELYCRATFSRRQANNEAVRGQDLNIEHAVPADRIGNGMGYSDRDCSERLRGVSANPACVSAISDLHDLWPAFARINSSRGKLRLSELSGEGTTNLNYAAFCSDFERAKASDGETYVEPTRAARGDIARSLIYMSIVYDLPLETAVDDQARLLRWHASDPPDVEEKRRERAIRELQGSWNPLVLPPPED